MNMHHDIVVILINTGGGSMYHLQGPETVFTRCAETKIAKAR